MLPHLQLLSSPRIQQHLPVEQQILSRQWTTNILLPALGLGCSAGRGRWGQTA